MSIVALLLSAVCGALFAVAAFTWLYHMLLAAVGLLWRKKLPSRDSALAHSFAILIPAHNEEAAIQATLDSCAALSYPSEKRHVYVVADNCTDKTAEIAQQSAATCLVRQNDRQRGKGFALEWAMPQMLAAGHDAVLILDADCLIDSNSLESLDAHLQSGARALQLNNAVLNPDHNVMSYLLAIANKLENELFYAPKSVLGLAVALRGTGMALHRSVLSQYPWQSRSATEDAEYSQKLFREGISVVFVPQCGVVSNAPTNRGQLRVQRTRWIAGICRLTCVQGPKMLLEGLRKRRRLLIDAAFTLFAQSRPLVAIQLLATILACAALYGIAPSRFAAALLIGSGILAAGYVLYALTGALMLGLNRRRIAMLFCLPSAALQYLIMALKPLCSVRSVSWTRTPRS